MKVKFIGGPLHGKIKELESHGEFRCFSNSFFSSLDEDGFQSGMTKIEYRAIDFVYHGCQVFLKKGLAIEKSKLLNRWIKKHVFDNRIKHLKEKHGITF